MDPGVQLNVSMEFINVPAAPASPVIQMRVDYWDEASHSYPAANSFKFYQTGTDTVSPGLPALILGSSDASQPAHSVLCRL